MMKRKHRSHYKPKVLDLFAGAGGFSTGFQAAGYTVVGGVEKDSWASETFAANHTGAYVLTRQIETLGESELKHAFANGCSPDVIIGGPPCQGFSIANCRNEDSRDPRNSLFMEMVRVAKILEPQLIVLENVPNLIRARTGEDESVIKIIERQFFELGYNVCSAVLSATSFGVPQIRKRLFVVGTKKEIQSPFPAATHTLDDANYTSDLFERDIHPCPSLWDAISDLPQLHAGEGEEISEYSSSPQTQLQKLLRNGSSLLQNHVAMKHGKRIVDRFKAMRWGQSGSDVPEQFKPRKRNSREIAKSVYDQNNRRMHPDKPCHTIPASFYANFVHPYCHRNFTAREGARLQSFPDTFVFKGKRTVVSEKLLAREGRVEEMHLCQYSQIGNAVPPLLASAVASNLKDQIWSE